MSTHYIPASQWKKSTKRVCKTIQIAKKKKAAKRIRYTGKA